MFSSMLTLPLIINLEKIPAIKPVFFCKFFLKNKQKFFLLNIINIRVKVKGYYMRISAINCQIKPAFTGENSTKHKLKNAAGAAAIALATMSPSAEADAQLLYPYPGYNYVQTSYNINVPTSFKYGDVRNLQPTKSREERFWEIDKNGNGIMSENEFVATEVRNWNVRNPMKATSTMVYQWQSQFRQLSRTYNQNNSNPNTINFNEYNNIMDDYDAQFDEINIIAPAIPLYPYFFPPPPPRYHHPHHHHHHHHR